MPHECDVTNIQPAWWEKRFAVLISGVQGKAFMLCSSNLVPIFLWPNLNFSGSLAILILNNCLFSHVHLQLKYEQYSNIRNSWEGSVLNRVVGSAATWDRQANHSVRQVPAALRLVQLPAGFLGKQQKTAEGLGLCCSGETHVEFWAAWLQPGPRLAHAWPWIPG